MIQAAIARVRRILQQDIDAADALSVEEAEREYPPDYGGNQDDAYAAGEEDGKVRGRAALARVLLAILPAAAESEEP